MRNSEVIEKSVNETNLTQMKLCVPTAESHSIAEEDEPEIVELIPNVTVPVGREARIPCKVRGLGTYRVSMHLRLRIRQTIREKERR